MPQNMFPRFMRIVTCGPPRATDTGESKSILADGAGDLQSPANISA
jgi:hypothetical protein